MSPARDRACESKAAERIDSGHLWIFASDVIDRGNAQPGAAVRLIDPRGRVLGTAHHSSTSQIALRLLSSRVEAVDEEFFFRRMEVGAAFSRARGRGLERVPALHAEGDLLPGLIVDRYGDVAGAATSRSGMDRQADEIVARSGGWWRRAECGPQRRRGATKELPPRDEDDFGRAAGARRV